MAHIRPPLMSAHSSHLRQRKYSSDRNLRQAELDVQIEEVHINIPTALAEEEVRFEAREHDTENNGAVLTSHNSHEVSPHDVHPGHRWDHAPTRAASSPVNSFDAIKPWKEPKVSQTDDDVERRTPVLQRQETVPIDIAYAQSQLRRPVLAMKQRDHRSPLSYRRNGRTPIEGLAQAASMSASFALSFTAQTSAAWMKRQQLHVLEYNLDKNHQYWCNSNLQFSMTTKLKHHLAGIKKEAAPRIIHVRNNEEAFKFLDDTFAISALRTNSDDRGFYDWMRQGRDRRQTSHMTIRWRPAYDVRRSVVCTAFGIDFGPRESSADNKTEHQPFHRRRIACYMQRIPSDIPRFQTIRSSENMTGEYVGHDTLVICEYSADATCDIASTSSLLALHPWKGLLGSTALMASAMRHICEETVRHWELEILTIHKEFTELEDRIYYDPAHARHAQYVWPWSQRLRYLLKLVLRHLKTIQAFQEDFCQFAEGEDSEWLDDILEDLRDIGDTISTDYIQPLEHMIDLIYKSVAIRDSRRSLELSSSLWRLSWITFVFLPMTFLVGFFGMNVAVFRNFPSIGWYFVALVPLSILVASFWIVLHKLESTIETWSSNKEGQDYRRTMLSESMKTKSNTKDDQL